jgi:SsrA-binding protein
MAGKTSHGKLVAQNRRARYNFSIEDTLEAGVVLTGSEVKSLRAGRVSLNEAWAGAQGGELYLMNCHVPVYQNAGSQNHEPTRPRKLLVRRRELDRLIGAVRREGRTLVPLRLYFNDRGVAKVELAVARGKRKSDKRETTKARDWQRQRGRLMRDKG